MSFASFIQSGLKTIANDLDCNSPKIMTALGVVGVLAASYMIYEEAPKIKAKKAKIEEKYEDLEEDDSKKEMIVEEIKEIAPIVVKPAVTLAASIFCIVKAQDISSKRLSAAVAAYDMIEGNYRRYRRSTLEHLGEEEELKIRKKVVEKDAEERPEEIPMSNEFIPGPGKELFREAVTGKYFWSTCDDIRQAEKTLIKRCVTENFVSLGDDLFYELGIDISSRAAYEVFRKIGWDNPNEIDFIFDATDITKDGRVYRYLDYRTPPQYEKKK